MIATVVISLLIAAGFTVAVRHVLRRGGCASCDRSAGCASGGSCCASGAPTLRGADAGPVDLGMPSVLRPGS